MPVFTRKKLSAVARIKDAAAFDTMDDTQFDAYCKHLDKFILNYPDASKALKEAFEARDQVGFSRNLLAVTGMLFNIGISDYAQTGIDLLAVYRNAEYEKTAAIIDNLLTAVSTLSIDLQMAKHKSETYISDDDYVLGDENGSRQKCILAVDDVSLLLNTLKSMLADSEYKFVGAISSAAALKYLENNKPDLFILDIDIPDMNGYDLAERIRALGFKAPVIFLTGNATNDYVVKAIKAGAADFIVKPVTKEYVLEKIKKFI